MFHFTSSGSSSSSMVLVCRRLQEKYLLYSFLHQHFVNVMFFVIHSLWFLKFMEPFRQISFIYASSVAYKDVLHFPSKFGLTLVHYFIIGSLIWFHVPSTKVRVVKTFSYLAIHCKCSRNFFLLALNYLLKLSMDNSIKRLSFEAPVFVSSPNYETLFI